MKILIADDEELIRFTIKDMIEESSIQKADIREAFNGRELISEFRRDKPDLILADIRMPGFSGLDAMEELREEKAHWIILTGHADFEYARQALKLGADDYLLKPPSLEELEKALLKIQKKILIEESENQRQLEHSLNQIITGSTDYEYEPDLQQRGYWSGWLIFLDSFLEEQQSLEIRNNLSRILRESLCSTHRFFERTGVVCLDRGSLFLCCFNSSEAETTLDLPDLLNSSLPEGQNIHIFKIPGDTDFRVFKQNWERVEQGGWQRLIHSPGTVQEIREDLPGKLEEFCKNLEEWITLSPDERDAEELENLMNLSGQAESFNAILENMQFLFPGTTETSITGILKESEHRVQISANQQRPILVDQAIRIIQEQFHDELGIAQIAYQLKVTPNYLSSLFRKHTGVPFTKYMTDKRIEKSTTLLKETNLNIKEIASQVGYRSSRHFSSVFRQEVGCSPTDYIKIYRH